MQPYEEYENFNNWFWVDLEKIINGYEEKFGEHGRKILREKFSSIDSVKCVGRWMIRYEFNEKNTIYQFTLSGAGKIVNGEKIKYTAFNFKHPTLFRDEKNIHPSDLINVKKEIYKNELKELLNKVELR